MNLRVKICGIKRSEDAILAAELGAKSLGFVFSQTRRRVEPERVKLILNDLAERGLREKIRAIGIFVNADPFEMQDIFNSCNLNSVQIHGDERPEEMGLFSFPWYRAFRVRTLEALNELPLTAWKGSRFLFDTDAPGEVGEIGMKPNIDVARRAVQLAKATGREGWISGGITPENVYKIVEETKPDGIDVSSGIEESPGIKSHEAMKKLFEQIAPFRDLS